jgi:hypothetical protein
LLRESKLVNMFFGKSNVYLLSAFFVQVKGLPDACINAVLGFLFLENSSGELVVVGAAKAERTERTAARDTRDTRDTRAAEDVSSLSSSSLAAGSGSSLSSDLYLDVGPEADQDQAPDGRDGLGKRHRLDFSLFS